MKRSLLLVVSLIFASVPVIGLTALPVVAATPCQTALGSVAGVTDVAPNCVVSSAIAKTGTVTLPAGFGLKITGTGSINATGGGGINITMDGNFSMESPTAAGAGRISTNGGALTLDVGGNVDMAIGSLLDTSSGTTNGGAVTITAANMTMHGNGASGAAITATGTGGNGNTTNGNGDGGAVTITVGNCDAVPPTGDFVTEPGAKIQSNSTKGAAGAIVVTGCHAIGTDGLIESVSNRTAPGGHQGPGGGPVTLVAGCELSVSDTGIVRSKGLDPGADLVHLQGGCAVTINGLVESTGVGHSVPDSPPNHCDSTNRPDKPANSTACVEIWSGQTIIIDGSGTHNGQVNADTGKSPGGSSGTSWIDIFAKDDIQIIAKTGVSDPYSVHADGNAGTNDNGGIVTVKSLAGQITMSVPGGKAISANALGSGGDGGVVTIEAFSNVALDGVSIQARGATTGGAVPTGGTISVRSYHGALTGAPPGELNAGGATLGTVKLEACSVPAYTGAVTGTLTTITTPQPCLGAPTLPGYVNLPECECQRLDVCPICDPDPTHNVVVDENVTVNFNGPTPTCDDGLTDDLCFYASFDKSGPTPDTWKVIFDVGPRKLIIKDGVIVTTTAVPLTGNNRMAPGIEIHGTCEFVIENDGVGQPGAVIVNSINQQAGNIVIQFQGLITIDGWVRNVVTGTNGRPGSITIASCCGDIVTNKLSRIETIGVDPGGNDINILTCCQRGYGGEGGDIVIQGLVMGINKGHPGTPVPNINIVSLVGSVTIDGTTPLGLEENNTVQRTSGVLARTTNASNSGNINIQALLEVKVIGRNIIDKNKIQFGAVAIKPLNTSGQGGDGDMKVTSLTGNVIGMDRAFDFENRFNALNAITLNAALDINLSVTASIDNGAANNSKPVVNSRGGSGAGAKGGTNTLRAYSGQILIGAGAQVLANFTTPPVGGSNGANFFTTCTGVVNNGTVLPAATIAGACPPPAAPDPLTWKGQLIIDCSVFGITEESFNH